LSEIGPTTSSADYFIERQQIDDYERRFVKQLERMGYAVFLTKRAA
jgi:hypothetical protein